MAFGAIELSARSRQRRFKRVNCASARSLPPGPEPTAMTSAAELAPWLSTSPLAWLALTLGVWCAADGCAEALGRHPCANPLLISIIAIVLLLKLTGTSYATYSSGAQFIQFLIGPAVVAIAVPLFRHWPTVKRNAIPVLTALLTGSVTAIACAMLLGRATRLPDVITMSLAPKSATTGAAMAISQSIGGEPAMTATFTVATSIVAAVVLISLTRLLRVKDMTAIGFAAGLSGHSVGTARAFQIDEVAGTFAGIALCLNAILTALIMPLVAQALQ
jgi:putative effector of murein hydrolase